MNKIESTVEGLKSILEYNLDKLLYSEKYKTILSRRNNLMSFDVLNRMVIACQNSKAVVLKTIEEWELEGRTIASEAKPVYIISPKYEIEYIDKETNKTLKDNDLTADERKLAMYFGMVDKQTNINELNVIKTYELYDTYSIDGEDYTINKPLLSIRAIAEIFKGVTEAKIEVAQNKLSYNEETNTLSIPSGITYDKFIDSISRIWAKWLIKNRILQNKTNTYNISIKGFSELEKKILYDSLTYAISSMLGGKFDIDIGRNSEVHKDKLIGILYIVDILMIEIVCRTKFKGESVNEDAVSKAYRLRKTNVILDSMIVAYLQNL